MKNIIAFALLSTLTALILTSSVSAANKQDFNPGRIIDDSVFYDSTAMNTEQIQTFLESKVPNCDVNGSGAASEWGYSNMTRAQFAEHKRNGTNGFSKDTGFHAPPYKCLRIYTQNTPQMEAASGLCEGMPAGANRSAAQIIADISRACGINPQVLIILLEKEQSLITDNWPLNRQLDKATGFACPDTAPCNPAFGGYFYQVYYAARQFKIYQAFPDRYNYVAGRSQAIRWSPDANCGSGQVFIENQATAALYIYTPYQPNTAAMNNLYGTGDSCSAYGNRNFWRIFTDWFGTTLASDNRQELYSKGTNTLTVGSQLRTGEFLTSANGRYILVMHPSGQLLMYKSKQLVWQSGSINWSHRGATISFQGDGNVVLYRGAEALWSTGSDATTANRLILQNDGNLVLYTNNNQVAWASDTAESSSALTYKGASLASGEKLQVDEFLRSPDWRYFLLMQGDGNLVLYTAGHTQPVWQSKSYNKNGRSVSLQRDGNLVIYSTSGQPVWASGTDGKSEYASLNLQSDGNLVLYSTSGQPVWASGTDGKNAQFISLQADGNLVMYNGSGPLWATGTDGKNAQFISLQADGNLVMYNTQGSIWASNTDNTSKSNVAYKCESAPSRVDKGGRLNKGQSLCSSNGLYKMVFQDDGNLVLYARTTTPKWATGTDGKFFRSDLNL